MKAKKIIIPVLLVALATAIAYTRWPDGELPINTKIDYLLVLKIKKRVAGICQ